MFFRQYYRLRDCFKLPFTVLLSVVIICLTQVVAIETPPTHAQDMMAHVDLSSDAMTKAELSRAEIIERLNHARSQNKPADLSNLALNGLNLTGLDFSNVNFRASNMNKTDFSNSIMRGVRLDQAWMLGARLKNCDLTGANIFQAQLVGADFENSDLSHSLIAANLSRANLKNARLLKANLSADMKRVSSNKCILNLWFNLFSAMPSWYCDLPRAAMFTV